MKFLSAVDFDRCEKYHSNRLRASGVFTQPAPFHLRSNRADSRVLLQNLDDLFLCVSALAHVRLPKERILPKTEGHLREAGQTI